MSQAELRDGDLVQHTKLGSFTYSVGCFVTLIVYPQRSGDKGKEESPIGLIYGDFACTAAQALGEQ